MKRKIKVLFLLLLAISTFLSFTIQSLVYAVEEGEQAESGGGDGGGAGGDGGGDGGIHFSGDYINDNTDSSDDGGNDENGDDGKCTTCGNEPQDNNNTNTSRIHKNCRRLQPLLCVLCNTNNNRTLQVSLN